MSGAALAIGGTLAGCMSCMVVVESLATKQPSAMNLMTFANFVFVTLEGLIFTSKFLTVPNQIPIRVYIPLVFLFFVVNVINNQALNFHVPVPLHIIFRSGSLLTSLLMNRFYLGRQYGRRQYLSVVSITAGIILCTLATAGLEKADTSIALEEAQKHFYEWAVGIAMLVTALILSSYMAICQEQMYANHGKHPREAMFYIHALSLPAFAFMGNDIYENAMKFTQSSDFHLFDINFHVPELWVLLILSASFQWVCIKFVYMANAEMDSLSVTLLVTLRKFLSLLVSIIYFGNVFTSLHWFGTALVFGGTLVFSNVDQQLISRFIRQPLTDKKKIQ